MGQCTMYIPGTWEAQKKAEIQTVVSIILVLGIKPRSTGRAIRAVNR